MFKDGHYKAFVFLAGPAIFVRKCNSLKGEPCNFMNRARPSMEACGLMYFRLPENNGFFH